MLLSRHMHVINHEPVGLKFLMMVSVLMRYSFFHQHFSETNQQCLGTKDGRVHCFVRVKICLTISSLKRKPFGAGISWTVVLVLGDTSFGFPI